MLIVGIDVAKEELDVCFLLANNQTKYQTFANTSRGIAQLQYCLKSHAEETIHICLEATGVYGDLLAETLSQSGYRVSVVNPARIKAYGRSQLRRNKTDQLDAALIADCCRTQTPSAWTAPSAEQKELKALVRHLDDLKQEYRRVANRIEAQRNSLAVLQQLKQLQDFIKTQMAQTDILIRNHVNKYPDLQHHRDLLSTIPGISHVTACRLIAELGDMRRFNNVRQLVAYVGLNPQQHQHHSGKKRATHGISKTGLASLRAALYMPAIVAKIHNPALAAFAKRLEDRGLSSKQIIVAVMRKLLHLAYGILKSGCAFDPNYAQLCQKAA